LLLVVCWSHGVVTQMVPLDLAQHTALMSVYDGLGSSIHFEANDILLLTFFDFFEQNATAQHSARDSTHRQIVLACD
jgi:hypothetical protein